MRKQGVKEGGRGRGETRIVETLLIHKEEGGEGENKKEKLLWRTQRQ